MASAKNSKSQSRGSKTSAHKGQEHATKSRQQDKNKSTSRAGKGHESKSERPQPKAQKSSSAKGGASHGKSRSSGPISEKSREAKGKSGQAQQNKGQQGGQREGQENGASGGEENSSGVTRVAKQHPLATAATAAVGAAGLGLMLAQGVRKYMKSGQESGGGQEDRGGRDDFGAGEEAEDYDDRSDEGSEAQASGQDVEASDDDSDEQDEESDEDDDDDSSADAEASGGDEGDAGKDKDDDDDEGEGGGIGGGISAITRYGRHGLERAGSSIRSGAMAVGHAAHEGYERGKELIAPQWEAHPLMICAAALAVGAAAGLLLPSTELEDRLMGSAADKMNEKIRQATEGMVGQGKRVVTAAVKEATDAVSREAEREGLTPDRLSRKVSRLVSHVKQAVTDAVEDA